MQLRLIFLVGIVVYFLFTSFIEVCDNYNPSFVKKYKTILDNAQADQWADSVIHTLSLEEKIGQLIMIDAHPQKDRKHWEKLGKLVSEYKVGGIIFFKAGPKQLALMNNFLQEKARIPLLTSIDAEWGLAMRMDSVLSFPVQMALGAINNNELIYWMGRSIARHCKRLGIHINFAPVVDVNNNPLNPVINVRSFSDNKKVVVEKALYYIRGLQDEHVLAVGKHFPGHGDTQTDSHHDLPYLNFSRKRLDTLELYPFKQIIKQGIGGIMVAHLDVPALDPEGKKPTTLSASVIKELLRNELGFNGVVFTDALNMKGATKYSKPGELALKALLAGNDILLYPEDVPLAVQYIKEAIEDSILCENELNEHVRKVLKLKYWVGLNHCTYVDTTNIYADLNNEADKWLIQQLTEQSITVLKNEQNILPVKKLDTLKIAYVVFDKKNSKTFYENLSLYAPIDTFCLPEINHKQLKKQIFDTLKHYNLIFISFHQTNRYSYRTFNFSEESLWFYKALDSLKIPIITVVFASPYSLKIIPELNFMKALIVCYESNYYTQFLAPQIIFGAIPAIGKLPISLSSKYPCQSGIELNQVIRLKYTIPEELGISSRKLYKIDSIVNYAIYHEVFPGCQILAIKNGKVFYHKAFGNLFYDSLPVQLNNLYDIASVTKIAATTLSCMYLYDKGKLNLQSSLENYFPYLKNNDKGKIILSDILTHQARFQSWIPFYKSFIKDSLIYKRYFSKTYSKNYPIKVADSLYAATFVKDSVFSMILKSHLLPTKKYVYSDLGFYLLKEVIEYITQQSINSFCSKTFYKPLGCITTTYQPLNRFNRRNIAPTEYDKEFRKQIVWGYVHDPGAALFDGIQGHAGLFSNANDLGKIGQMLLWNGEYGGERFFKASTVKYFTQCYACPQNRRGLGFDKPEPNPEKESPVTRKASLLTFGHQGFTGTCMWIDPKQQLVYVFLSNRVHPSAENKKINTLNIRNRILEVIYESIETK